MHAVVEDEEEDDDTFLLYEYNVTICKFSCICLSLRNQVIFDNLINKSESVSVCLSVCVYVYVCISRKNYIYCCPVA
jgi:hypothetical protein